MSSIRGEIRPIGETKLEVTTATKTQREPTHTETKSDSIFQKIFHLFSIKKSPVVIPPDRTKKFSGAAKNVYVSQDEKTVFSTARKTILEKLFKTNSKELADEAKTCDTIRATQKKPYAGKNIALLTKEDERPGWYKGEYAKQGSLESVLTKGFVAKNEEGKDVRDTEHLKESMEKINQAYGRDLLRGMVDLHKCGLVHGDMKPDNCLIGDNGLQITDFGKAKNIAPGQTLPYQGNPRFAPPEGILSEKSDVYGAALILIRLFETLFLEEGKLPGTDSMIKENPDTPHKGGTLQGIDRFAVEHKAFIAKDRGTLEAITSRINLDKRSEKLQEAQKGAVHTYIDKLTNSMSATGIDKEKAKAFAELLKDMTQLPAEERLTMEQALERYDEIFPK